MILPRDLVTSLEGEGTMPSFGIYDMSTFIGGSFVQVSSIGEVSIWRYDYILAIQITLLEEMIEVDIKERTTMRKIFV